MSRPDRIRIANAGGYWGDDLSQFKRQVELGPVDVVTLDFLAEITMSTGPSSTWRLNCDRSSPQ